MEIKSGDLEGRHSPTMVLGNAIWVTSIGWRNRMMGTWVGTIPNMDVGYVLSELRAVLWNRTWGF